MSRTPRSRLVSQRSGGSRSIAAATIAEMSAQPCHRPRFTSLGGGVGYQPNESLYDGQYCPLSDGSGEEQDTHSGHKDTPYRPLASSSRYNMQDQQPVSAGPSSAEIVTMLQEQQQLLHRLLETQTKMQQKQDDFDSKLKQLATQYSESSSSSPDVRGKRKCRITRDLTVGIILVM